MKKQFTSMVLCASLALTAVSTTPVRASEQDVWKALLGIGAIVAIGTAINKENKRKEAQRNRTVSKSHTHRNQNVGEWLKQEDFKKIRKKQVRKVAPERCVRTQWTHRGYRDVYGARCMQRHAQAKLPNQCLRRATTNEGPRRFYTERCLRQNGWRT